MSFTINLKAYLKCKSDAEKAGVDVSLWSDLDEKITEEIIREFNTAEYYTLKAKASLFGLDTSKWVDPDKPVKKFKCPINYEGCNQYCGSYGCGG
jgi:hypothetical protein